MDPLTAAIVNVLGKYAIDKGATLLKEAGQAAVNVAGKLFQNVMDRLKVDPAEARNAERFEQNPEGYKTPVADAIAQKVKSDPDFAIQLKALLEDYERAVSTAGASNVNIGSVGSGAVAANGGMSAGAGGVVVGGNVQGGITLNNKRDPPPS